ncbi:MAG: RNA 3'-terminal phosphate cyclase [Candidatus Aenigmatarchaeota archaeon]
MIELDGSYLEGGGSIVRVGVALSAVTEKPCRIFNIRKGRCNPGLQYQHIEAINAVANLCDAKVIGVSLKSKEIEFFPNKIKSGEIKIKIPTAGSIGLILQSILIASIHAKDVINIEIDGGATNGKWAAPVNYIKNVISQFLEKMGYKIKIDIKKYGYYPKGGAKVNARIEPCKKLKPLNIIECGKIISIDGISHASKFLEKLRVAERQREIAYNMLLNEFGIEPNIEIKYVDSLCPGSALDLWCKTENSFFGSDGLGERGKRAEDVGREAATHLIEQIKSGAVDEHAEDQLLPYMALTNNSSIRIPKLTNHTKTNIWVIEKFLPVKFDIDEENKIIRCIAL